MKSVPKDKKNTIKSEENKNKNLSNDSIIDVDFEEVEHINEDNEEEINNISSSEEVDPTELNKKQKAEKVKVNFMTDDGMKSFVQKEAKKSSSENDSEDKKDYFEGKNVNDIRKDIEEEEDKEQFTKEDFQEIAEILLDLLDAGVSTGLKVWAGDKSDYAYSLPAAKKKKLKFQLVLILVKYQAKFRIEFLFILSLLIMYYGPYTKARQFRKSQKSEEEEEIEETTFEEVEDEDEEDEEEEDEQEEKPKKRRRRGRPPGSKNKSTKKRQPAKTVRRRPGNPGKS